MAAKLQPGEARFGLELDWEKLWRHQVFGAKMSETSGNKRLSFARDSEEVFGSESATRGGSFWTRIRLGKAVASPGVRGQDERMSETNGNRRLFFSATTGGPKRGPVPRPPRRFLLLFWHRMRHVFRLQHSMPHKNKPCRWGCGV